jgi:hypothetical protein
VRSRAEVLGRGILGTKSNRPHKAAGSWRSTARATM